MLRRVLGFLLRFFIRSFTKAMGCFFACFRIRDNRRTHSSQFISASTRSTGVVISRNRLSSLLSEEERDDSARDDGVGSQGDLQGLKDEAKFLKACGTLTGTPAEIRKALRHWKHHPLLLKILTLQDFILGFLTCLWRNWSWMSNHLIHQLP